MLAKAAQRDIVPAQGAPFGALRSNERGDVDAR